MSASAEIEEGTTFTPKFDASGLIPVIAQDWQSGTILMLAYMNADALRETRASGEAVYWSRSRGELWKKGATSGQIQKVHQILVDCDQDALILKIEQLGGGACHTGRESCFYRAFAGKSEDSLLTFLKRE